jgi:CheY-like chemotaxis protein
MARQISAEPPILFYSASVDESEMQRAMSVGAQGYLARPVEAGNLLQTISHYTTTDHTPLDAAPSDA